MADDSVISHNPNLYAIRHKRDKSIEIPLTRREICYKHEIYIDDMFGRVAYIDWKFARSMIYGEDIAIRKDFKYSYYLRIFVPRYYYTKYETLVFILVGDYWVPYFIPICTDRYKDRVPYFLKKDLEFAKSKLGEENIEVICQFCRRRWEIIRKYSMCGYFTYSDAELNSAAECFSIDIYGVKFDND